MILNGKIDNEQSQLNQIRADQDNFPEPRDLLDEWNIQLGLDQETVRFLTSQQYQAQITSAAASAYVTIVDSASGAYPVTTGGQTNLLSGAILGLILGVGAAFFLDPATEAYRNLRMNIMFMSTEEKPIRTLIFSSSSPSKSINFHVMLAQQGERVLPVDADIWRPALHRAMDVLREPGLTDLLIGDVELCEAVQPNVLPNLDVLPSGPFPPNPSEFLNSKKMQELLVGVRVFGAVLNEVASTAAEESYYMQYY